ncbi:MAG: RNA polymerase sigma-70 factor [Chitinophagaceae bacterium]|nr:MAG: RNA polymerase sigma-70 factor [Chitinophagaceae bacterium]
MSPLLPEDEKLLLEQISEDNEGAFAQLFYAYRDKLYSFIFRITGSKELSSDIVQDVFLKIWEQRGRLFSIENFNAYLFRMAQNHAINQLKRSSKTTLVMMQKQRQEGFESPPPDEEFRYKIMQQRLQQIVNDLPLQQKTVYQFSREQNLKQEEIARQMNIALSTVQNHLTQALKTIRDRLKEHLT